MGPNTNTVVSAVAVPGHSPYYGWPVLVIAAVAMVGTLPGRTQGLGLITEPLIAALAVDRVTYAEINLWATLIGALFCLPCGRLTDLFGSRVVLTCVVGALGLTVIAMSQVTQIAALAATITLTRGLGQSALSVVSLALVGKWFSNRINVAMGVYSLLVGIGFIIAFPTVGRMTLDYGWRTAWLGVGMVLAFVLTPVAWLTVRNNPEETTLDEATQSENLLRDISFSEALRSPAFWVFALASSLFGLAYSGIALFNQSILEERGFNAGMYHTVLVIVTIIGLAANFAGGWIATKWSIQRLMGIGMAVLGVALLMLPFVSTMAHVSAYAVAMGVAGGVVTVVFFSVWAQVFGRTHLGRIQGCAQMMTVIASALGPWLLAKTLERTGSYELIFFTLSVFVVALGIASWLVRLPTRSPIVA